VDPPDQPGEIDYTDEQETERWRINVDIGPVPFDQGFYTVKIGNESGKININSADGRLLGMMLDGFDLEDDDKDTIVDSILDWRDSDKLHRLNGAEDDYYLSLSDPYPCKDGDFDSLEELMLVKGVTREIYYGGLNEMITIYTGGSSPTDSQASRRAKASGSGGININAASDKMLKALPLMTDDLVEAVKAYRKEEDFESMTDLVSVVGQEAADAMRTYIHFSKVRFYNIRSIGMFKGIKTRKGIEALIQIDIRSEKGFRVIRWIDDVDYQVIIPAS
jgi:general secretion pathway protein K